MSRFSLVISALIAFAMLNTSLLALELSSLSGSGTVSGTTQSTGNGAIAANPLLSALQTSSPVLAPASWIAVLGAITWRRKSRWNDVGLDQDIFRLMTAMKGSRSRESILKNLSTPKDRLQLANGLGMDWKTVDYHIRILLKHGLVYEQTAYGNVRLYELTGSGKMILNLLETSDIDFGTKVGQVRNV